jgi:chromosomal replication initiation ATPase DnaA
MKIKSKNGELNCGEGVIEFRFEETGRAYRFLASNVEKMMHEHTKVLRQKLAMPAKELTAVSNAFNVHSKWMVSSRCSRAASEARAVYAYLLKTEYGFSNGYIAETLNMITESAISKYVRRTKDRMEVDKPFREKVSNIRKTLYGESSDNSDTR